MRNLTKQTCLYLHLTQCINGLNVYQFKALDTFVVDVVRMEEQLDNTVTNSSWSSSPKAEPPSKVTQAWPWT